MGRPLYSRAFKTPVIATPVVREPEEPTLQRWSYLNAFDPDSDDFFDSENAVYEDIIGPVTPVTTVPLAVDGRDPVEEEVERDMLVVRMSNASPIPSSEGSLSDNESPLAGAEEDVAQIDEPQSPLEEPAVRVRLASRRDSFASDWSQPRRGHMTTATIRPASYMAYAQRGESLAVPTPSAPIPVPTASRRSVMGDDRVLPSPTTPPRQTPVAHFAMSPPPTSTPRLYSWSRNSSHSTPPSASGPFTNPHARTSYTHLSPAFIRIRDVTV